MRQEAIRLRQKGRSIKEIGRFLRVPANTVSLWLRDIILDKRAQARLLSLIKQGQFIGAAKRHVQTMIIGEKYFQAALEEIQRRPNYKKIICAMMFWCEGNKNPKSGMAFTNSDPTLVKVFLRLLRQSFVLNEGKFHPCVHIHSYHSAQKQLDFWSKITSIDKQQFIKSCRKPNTGRRIRENYQGCITVRYHSNDLARQLLAVARAFLHLTGA